MTACFMTDDRKARLTAGMGGNLSRAVIGDAMRQALYKHLPRENA